MPALRLDPDLLQPAFDALASRVESGRVTAAVLAVATSDRVVRAETFGSVEGRQVTLDDRFFLASITKPIVATAVMQLAEEGRISLVEPLRTYLPDLAADRADVTAWHILTHTAGIVDRWVGALDGTATRDDLVRGAFTAPLAFAPGSRYAYCSNSFFVLAELLARLDGVAFEESLRRRILRPLGMDGTSFDPFTGTGTWVGIESLPAPETDDGGSADLDPATAKRLVAHFSSLAMPGGGLWGTAPDLLRFARAYLRGGSLDGARILGPAFVDMAGREQTRGILESSPDGVRPPRDPHYALGWGKPYGGGDIPCSERAIEHGGASGTRLFIDPQTDLAIVVLANRWDDSETSRSVVASVHGALVPA